MFEKRNRRERKKTEEQKELYVGDIVKVPCREGTLIVLDVFETKGHKYVSLFDTEKNMYFPEMIEMVFKTGRRINIDEIPQIKIENLRRKKNKMEKVGDKFIIEIESVMTNKNGTLYGIKGLYPLCISDEGLNNLENYNEKRDGIQRMNDAEREYHYQKGNTTIRKV